MIELPQGTAHMPFVSESGEGVYCVGEIASAGTFEYRAWSPAFMGGERIRLPHALEPSHPLKVICNPVLSGGFLSFIRGGKLYGMNFFTGAVTEAASCVSGFIIKDAIYQCDATRIYNFWARVWHPTPFERILRMVPAIDSGGLLLTGGGNGKTFSAVFHRNNWYRVLVQGQDIYKCCQHEGGLIHAKFKSGIEGRELEFAPDFELVPMECLPPGSDVVESKASKLPA